MPTTEPYESPSEDGSADSILLPAAFTPNTSVLGKTVEEHLRLQQHESLQLIAFGRFRLTGLIGRGGMGTVYEAEDRQTHGRTVALKVIAANAGIYATREPSVQTKIASEHVVVVFATGETDGVHWLSMERLTGPTLAELVSDVRKLPVRDRWVRIAQWMVEAARGVAAVHRASFIHRDLKPANLIAHCEAVSSPPSALHAAVLAGKGKVKVADFGVAKSATTPAVTDAAVTVGTLNYMAPEQLDPRHSVTAATDVYGMGAVFYELLVGFPPVPGDPGDSVSRKQMTTAILRGTPFAPRSIDPEIPLDLETLCLRCLEKDPRNRIKSVEALGTDCERFLRFEPIRARPPRWPERLGKWSKRHPVWTVFSAACAVILTLAGSFITWHFTKLQRKNNEVIGLNASLEQANDELKQSNDDLLQSRAKIIAQRQSLVEWLAKVVDRFQAVLKYLPRSEAIRKEFLVEAQGQLKELARFEEITPAADETLARSLSALGDIFHDLGDNETAARLYEKCRANVNRMLADDAANERLNQLLGETMLRQGEERLMSNRVAEAARHYREAHDHFTKMKERNPAEGVLRALATATRGQGHVSMKELDFKNALIHFQAWNRLCGEVWRLSGQPIDRRRLATSHRDMGDAAFEDDNIPLAKEYFVQALRLNEALLHVEPGPRTLRDLSEDYDKVAQICIRENKFFEAYGWCERQVQIDEQLLESDPLLYDRQRSLMVSCNRMADVALVVGEAGIAKQALTRGRDLARRSVDNNHHLRESRRDLAYNTFKWAEYNRQTGQEGPAREEYVKAIVMARKLHEEELTGQSLDDLLFYVLAAGEGERRVLEFGKARQYLDEAKKLLAATAREGSGGVANQFRRHQNRWQRGDLVCQHVEDAIRDLDEALKQPADVALELMVIRVQSMIRHGEVAEAARTAERMPLAFPKISKAYGWGARCLADCYRAADPDLPEQKTRIPVEVRNCFSQRAVELLRRGKQLQFPDLGSYLAHASFDVLRADGPFQILQAEWRELLQAGRNRP